jgi:hypothetical protein
MASLGAKPWLYLLPRGQMRLSTLLVMLAVASFPHTSTPPGVSL